MSSLRFTPLLLMLAGSALANPWADVAAPTDGPARAIGETNAGCMSGAAALPTEGEGYMVMHLERRRYFGHPALVEAIQTLGEKAAQGLGVLHVGDLGMARGGPMPFGHRSHQSGLDTDIWFDLNPDLHARANRLRSNVPAPSLLRGTSGLDYRLWSHRQVQILKAAANLPKVDRIFVNAHIKKELCDTVLGSDRGWLRKIRPWYYHDDHFHMRLTCPPDSPDCVRQAPVPLGEGCDASLDWWFHRQPATTTKPSEPRPVMPAACRGVLAEP